MNNQTNCLITLEILKKTWIGLVKFTFSEKATKIDEIFTIDLTTVTAYCQIDAEDFSIFVAFSENVNFTELHAPF